jgi:hypothetical protein
MADNYFVAQDTSRMAERSGAGGLSAQFLEHTQQASDGQRPFRRFADRRLVSLVAVQQLLDFDFEAGELSAFLLHHGGTRRRHFCFRVIDKLLERGQFDQAVQLLDGGLLSTSIGATASSAAAASVAAAVDAVTCTGTHVEVGLAARDGAAALAWRAHTATMEFALCTAIVGTRNGGTTWQYVSRLQDRALAARLTLKQLE